MDVVTQERTSERAATDDPPLARLLRGAIVERHLDLTTPSPWGAVIAPRRSGWGVLAGEDDSSDASCYSTADPAECSDSSDASCYSTSDPSQCNPGPASVEVRYGPMAGCAPDSFPGCVPSVVYAGDDGCSNQTSYGVPCTPDTSDGPGCEPQSSADFDCEA